MCRCAKSSWTWSESLNSVALAWRWDGISSINHQGPQQHHQHHNDGDGGGNDGNNAQGNSGNHSSQRKHTYTHRQTRACTRSHTSTTHNRPTRTHLLGDRGKGGGGSGKGGEDGKKLHGSFWRDVRGCDDEGTCFLDYRDERIGLRVAVRGGLVSSGCSKDFFD